MGLLTKYGTSSLSSFSDAPEIIYGTGSDGSVDFDGFTIVLGLLPSLGVYTLTRDIFCNTMRVLPYVQIIPNGYRIFVKNELVMTQASIIGFSSGFSGSGSIAGGGTGAVTHSLGGGNGDDPGFSATPPTSSLGGSNYYRQAINATRGYALTPFGGPTYLRGGAGNGSSPGGGVVICAARYITFSGPGTIGQFKAPATPSTANGGGVVLTISTSASLPANITVDVGGGTNGIYSGGNGNHFHIQAV
jgi:hypothetical protein